MTNRAHPPLDEIAAALDRSEAEILAGDVVPADEVHRMIQERLDRIEARLSGRRRAASPRR